MRNNVRETESQIQNKLRYFYTINPIFKYSMKYLVKKEKNYFRINLDWGRIPSSKPMCKYYRTTHNNKKKKLTSYEHYIVKKLCKTVILC